jgi:hypothetical protein
MDDIPLMSESKILCLAVTATATPHISDPPTHFRTLHFSDPTFQRVRVVVVSEAIAGLVARTQLPRGFLEMEEVE